MHAVIELSAFQKASLALLELQLDCAAAPTAATHIDRMKRKKSEAVAPVSLSPPQTQPTTAALAKKRMSIV